MLYINHVHIKVNAVGCTVVETNINQDDLLIHLSKQSLNMNAKFKLFINNCKVQVKPNDSHFFCRILLRQKAQNKNDLLK